MIDAVLGAFGRVDILVNNAAKFSELQYSEFAHIPLDEWKAVLEVNVTGTFLCARAVEPHMRKAGWGRIVSVASGSIRMGRPHFLHYVSSKSALVGMSRALARELGPHGITVNTLLPGVVFTEMQRKRLPDEYQRMILAGQCIPEPLPPESMVGPALFLASDESRYMTGQELAVDGGLTHG
jgi:3-oxoacyl-[acyl-carrier protein] reductase